MPENFTGELRQTVGLDQIATATFRTSASIDEKLQLLKDALGFGAFNIPSRLAIARSLALPEAPPAAQGEQGRGIKGDTLFGTGADLAAWVSLIVEHAGREPETLREFQALVAAHWARGAEILADALETSGRDAGEFWRTIAEAALPEGVAAERPDSPDAVGEIALVPVPIVLPIGEVSQDAATGGSVVWALNAPGNSPHAALMGGVGSGKTRTAAAMLRAIRERTQVPLLAFDFKGDMADDNNRLHETFEATVLTPPHQPVPLDVLTARERSRTGIALAAQRLRDSLATLRGAGFGAVQKGLLGDAAERALATHVPCTLADILDALRKIYAEQDKREDGAVTTLVDLCRFSLFEPQLPPAKFFARSWIIRLTSDLPDLVKVSVVTLITDALDRYLNSLPDSLTDPAGNRALRVLCVVDEAHRILGTPLPGLSGLIRLSRSKGGSVMLISQGPDDFSGEDDEFLNEMGLVVAFRTNADPRAVRRILGPGANLATLERGQAWVKMSSEPAARRVLAWR